MHFLILGASGRTGQLTTAEALVQGHAVTALVRNSDSIAQQQGLTIVPGSSLNGDDLEKAFSNQPIDATIITLAVQRESDNPFAKRTSPQYLIRDTIHTLLPVMRKHSVNRLVILSASGVGSSFAQSAWPLRMMFRHTNLSYAYEDHDAVDREVRELADVEWTMFRPCMLKDGKALPIKEYGEDGKGLSMFAGVTRASVAEALVSGAADERRWRHQAVVIAN
ncbi:NAD(P) binding domain-containing protein [Dothistroma septosporum NZE10]|uniref:NAD(P) binding domain-containing protein n=1 Tax=Dothistroma septosporum (strain NZE10 / CBS 128990) TaxID=675120 RepID=M2Y372_DOTSN|nr:NAD(P) binding domain-containing protein [Dothistroma septosporum NZE10]